MAAARVDRRLAAILAADVVGYARLIERDEAGTLERLKEHRKSFIEPLIAEHHGRIVKLMGDGALCEFGSVVDAVACAIAIQRGMAEREADPRRTSASASASASISATWSLDEGDLFGDGVNVAARLEQLARARRHRHLRHRLRSPPGQAWLRLSGSRRAAGQEHRAPGASVSGGLRAGRDGSAAAASPWSGRSGLATAALGRQWPVLAAVVALVVIGAGIIGWLRPWQSSGEMAGPTLDTRRVAVLPFANISADAGRRVLRRRHDRGADLAALQDRQAQRDRPHLDHEVQGHEPGRCRDRPRSPGRHDPRRQRAQGRRTRCGSPPS